MFIHHICINICVHCHYWHFALNHKGHYCANIWQDYILKWMQITHNTFEIDKYATFCEMIYITNACFGFSKAAWVYGCLLSLLLNTVGLSLVTQAVNTVGLSLVTHAVSIHVAAGRNQIHYLEVICTDYICNCKYNWNSIEDTEDSKLYIYYNFGILNVVLNVTTIQSCVSKLQFKRHYHPIIC